MKNYDANKDKNLDKNEFRNMYVQKSGKLDIKKLQKLEKIVIPKKVTYYHFFLLKII